ncbi:MAG: hypothetical protein LBS62_13075 [Clostridiales bacterium]|jgi:hypothetical protein|nr:hypothetical protein [Clostridiales bacterium]
MRRQGALTKEILDLISAVVQYVDETERSQADLPGPRGTEESRGHDTTG